MTLLFFERILQEFCQRNHLSGEQFDEDACCHLAVDGYLPLLLRADVDNARLTLYGPVRSRISGNISPSLIHMIKQQVLAVNVVLRNQGPCLIPQTPWMLGYRHLAIASLRVEVLEEEIEKFAYWLEHYR